MFNESPCKRDIERRRAAIRNNCVRYLNFENEIFYSEQPARYELFGLARETCLRQCTRIAVNCTKLEKKNNFAEKYYQRLLLVLRPLVDTDRNLQSSYHIVVR